MAAEITYLRDIIEEEDDIGGADRLRRARRGALKTAAREGAEVSGGRAPRLISGRGGIEQLTASLGVPAATNPAEKTGNGASPSRGALDEGSREPNEPKIF